MVVPMVKVVRSPGHEEHQHEQREETGGEMVVVPPPRARGRAAHPDERLRLGDARLKPLVGNGPILWSALPRHRR
jgi:hypothetical protein